jgi:hypothetical protein
MQRLVRVAGAMAGTVRGARTLTAAAAAGGAATHGWDLRVATAHQGTRRAERGG